jgi:hypothetical protein
MSFLQVNPWMGNEWLIYNEYYQWSPSHNQNSAQHVVKAGDQLYGSIKLNAATKSYDIYHNVSGSTTWDVTMNIPIQKGKTYTVRQACLAASRRGRLYL